MTQRNPTTTASRRRRRRRHVVVSFLLVVLCLISTCSAEVTLNEEERQQAYRDRNYTWPRDAMTPDTVGWRKLLNRRLAQVARIDGTVDRYNGWVATMTSAFVAPNFTENGWGLTKAPPGLVKELRDSLHKGLPDAPKEYFIDVIEGDEDSRPLFIQQDALNKKVLEELKPLHEAWSGVPLTGAIAYGLRAYQNNSNLLMHVDKSHTHVISCILHVDHSEDSEPWPIYIEDFQGNTNEVLLQSGDMMFYESSKCIHGRPKTFIGSWYCSIFVHYYPTEWDTVGRDLESHYAVPPQWSTQAPPADDLDRMVMVGTSMKEPDCPNLWCNTQDTVKWQGGAKEGVIISTGYKEEDGGAREEL